MRNRRTFSQEFKRQVSGQEGVLCVGGDMKVGELRERLGEFAPELEVLCYTEDAQLVTADMGFRLLDIEGVSKTQGKRMRLDDNTPYLQLGGGEDSVGIVTLEVTQQTSRNISVCDVDHHPKE